MRGYRRNDLGLDLARQQIVLVLAHHKTMQAVFLRDPLRLRDLRSRHVRTADVAHLALRDERVERAQRFLDRRRRIGTMVIIKIDPIGLQALEARLDRARDVARRAAFELAFVVHRHAEFGDQHDILAAGAERLPQDRLRSAAVAVNVGGVENRDAGIERRVHDVARGRRIEPAAEIIAAEPERRDTQVRRAELTLTHAGSPPARPARFPHSRRGSDRAPPARSPPRARARRNPGCPCRTDNRCPAARDRARRFR